ncbi:MAG: prenyltransferase, partial [Chloroflexota bacterium]
MIYFIDGVLPPNLIKSSLSAWPVAAWGYSRYTRQHNPLPTVAAMIVFLLAQIIGWASVVVR